jgi:hypothetical protein
MKISIVMPCYNEINTIAAIIDKVMSVELDQEKELIIVDDGSKDGTRDYLATLNGRPGYQGRLAAPEPWQRLCAAHRLRTCQRRDHHHPGCRPGVRAERVPAPARADRDRAGRRGVWLALHRQRVTPRPVLLALDGQQFLTLLSNVFTNLNLTDMEVCYKVFKRSILQDFELKEERFGFEPEFTARIAKGGYTVYEVGISYYGRTYEEGKKINWKDGIRAVYVILKYGLFR